MLKDAVFQEVKIVEEKHFQVENMANDPTAQAIVKTSEIPAEKIKKITNTVTSVKVSPFKPRAGHTKKKREVAGEIAKLVSNDRTILLKHWTIPRADARQKKWRYPEPFELNDARLERSHYA